MNILTDEEIISIENTTASRSYNYHARAIEAAVLSKLAEQAIEPIGYWHSNDPVVYAYPTSDYFPGEALSNDAINIVPLFSEAQLIAAQQRTAEACAKVCDGIADEAWSKGEVQFAYRCAAAIRNGEWREYL